MKEKLTQILLVILMGVLVYKLVDISAAYKTLVEGNANVNIEPWVVFVNNENIATTEEKTFELSSIILESQNTKSGKIAPGTKFQIPIEIDATKMSNMAVRYDITLKKDEDIPLNIKIQEVIQEIEGLTVVRTGENTYTGIVTKEEIEQKIKHKVLINLIWENDEANNEIDTSFGTKENTVKFQVPVDITVAQYGGEEIVEYTEGT